MSQVTRILRWAMILCDEAIAINDNTAIILIIKDMIASTKGELIRND